MDLFKKPYFPNAKTDCRYPYTLEFLRSEPIFPLFIIDGGAFYLANDLMGHGWDSDIMAMAAMDGSLFSPWKAENIVNWDLPYRQYCRSGVPAPLEQYVWINRLYFLMALASRYLRTGNEEAARVWYRCFTSWNEAHPYREIAEDEDYLSNLIWRDMQVTWRLLSVVHSIMMLSETNTFGEAQWGAIYDFVHRHADHLLLEAQKHIEKQDLHNHILQIGTALLYTACLFPELEHSQEYENAGRRIIAIQLSGALHPDGGSDEECGSYSLFIARLYLEAFLLLSHNGKAAVEGLEESIHKQYEWVFQMSDPAGNTLLFNDAYRMNAMDDIKRISQIFPLRLNGRSPAVFSDSKCAAFHSGPFDAYIDGMDLTQVHQHGGRPNIILFYNGRSLITDSGCCGYDHHGLHRYLLSEWAHNTICIHKSKSPDPCIRSADEIKLVEYNTNGKQFISFQVCGERDGILFSRRRTITVEPYKTVIRDEVSAAADVHIQSLLHLAPMDLTQNGSRVTVHESGTDQDIHIVMSGDIDTIKIDYRPAVGADARITYSPVVVAQYFGQRAVMETVVGAAI